ncbi:hypothetical protein [Nonomuraea sp. NPDC003214]
MRQIAHARTLTSDNPPEAKELDPRRSGGLGRVHAAFRRGAHADAKMAALWRLEA